MKIQPNNDVLKILNSLKNNDVIIPKNMGIGKEEFFQQTLPLEDLPPIIDTTIDNGFRAICNKDDIRVIACAKILGASRCTNSLLYPENSMMKWHTDSNDPGKRIYYTYTEGESIFRYADKNGVIHSDYDNVGEWTVRTFELTKNPPLWHTIWTEKKRYAFGFIFV